MLPTERPNPIKFENERSSPPNLPTSKQSMERMWPCNDTPLISVIARRGPSTALKVEQACAIRGLVIVWGRRGLDLGVLETHSLPWVGFEDDDDDVLNASVKRPKIGHLCPRPSRILQTNAESVKILILSLSFHAAQGTEPFCQQGRGILAEARARRATDWDTGANTGTREASRGIPKDR